MDASSRTRSRRIELYSAEMCGPGSPPGRCACREAVTRGFHSMLGSGASAPVAFDVAFRIYRHHHPQATSQSVVETVESWLFGGPVH